VSDQVSHPYTTTSRIIVLYILIFIFLDSKLEDKWFCTEWQQSFPDFNLLLISSWIEIWFVKFDPKYLKCSTLSTEILSVFILWHLLAFWSRDKNIYLVLPAFVTSPVSLLATTKDSVFFILRTLTSNILILSASTRSQCVPFNFKLSWFTRTLLISLFPTFCNSTNICLHGLCYGFHSDSFISLTCFMGIPNWMRIK